MWNMDTTAFEARGEALRVSGTESSVLLRPRIVRVVSSNIIIEGCRKLFMMDMAPCIV